MRNLSGAIVSLKNSLKFNKYNIDARNLLGLIYCETGEVVDALSEWHKRKLPLSGLPLSSGLPSQDMETPGKAIISG